MIYEKEGSLYYAFDNETVRIDAWGKDAVRVRATRNHGFTAHDWALDAADKGQGRITLHEDAGAGGQVYANMYSGKNLSNGVLENGRIRVEVNADGVLSFYNQKDRLLLQENWRRLRDEPSMALDIPGREYKVAAGDCFATTVRFHGRDEEKIFGMGQYQQKYLNMKGCMLELAQRNSQVSVPFYVSSIGYGFLWNNPAVGRVAFGMNGTEWHAECTRQIDYLVIAGDTPAQIEETYMSLTGRAPMMPEYGLGFWQCKLRYQTQEQLLTVARKYKELGLPLDVIVADFFHWTQQGEYKFDPKYWPDVPAMCRELEEMGVKLMVSIWPTVDYRSENFREMMEKGYLVRTEHGVRISMTCFGQELFFDATNPEARAFVWGKVKSNYWDQGAKLYWLDVAEPEYTTYDFANFRYQLGSVLEVGNIYPRMYTQGFYDGMTAEGDETPVNLVRSAWAGSAKYGALVWSGDIDCTFECFNRQMRAGLSMAMAGIPWWTTDIGGFHGAETTDPEFRKLFVRWFAYACFCPVMRLHGNRNPQSGFEGDMISGIGLFGSGADNEVWSYGEEIFEICKKYMNIREQLRPYVREQMQLAHEKGTPVMRPLFYDFPEDAASWDVDDAYMFGPELLVAPVLWKDVETRQVYLPAGCRWTDCHTGKVLEGGQTVTAEAPADVIPVFRREGSELALKL